MSNLSVAQMIMDAQRIASRVKDLELLGSALLVEAEGNNRLVESMRQFQDDMDSLNRISNNKTNAEMVNRIQQQNANSSEILKENRELKICLEDYERAMELIMQKYREHTNSKVLESKINFKEVYNERLWNIIWEQREKINEMAAIMQRAASADDDAVNRELEQAARLKQENKTLREMLQISRQFGTANCPIRVNDLLLEEKGVQTDGAGDDSADELSLSGASIENANNNSVISLNNTDETNIVTNNTADAITAKRKSKPHDTGENNNGPLSDGAIVGNSSMSRKHTDANTIPIVTSNTGTVKKADVGIAGNAAASGNIKTAQETATKVTGVGGADTARAAT